VGTGAAKGRWGLLVIVLHHRLVLVGWEMVEAEGVDSGGVPNGKSVVREERRVYSRALIQPL